MFHTGLLAVQVCQSVYEEHVSECTAARQPYFAIAVSHDSNIMTNGLSAALAVLVFVNNPVFSLKEDNE